MAEKMILIPEGFAHQHEEIERKKTVYPTLMRIENEISNILDSQLHSDFEKVVILNQLQQRYKAIEGTAEPMKLKIQSEENEIKINPDVVFSEVINSLAKSKRAKAAQILTYIKSNENVINWDHRKRLVIDGKPVEDSNIVELVKMVVDKSRKSDKPKASDLFIEYLNRIGIPTKQLSDQAIAGEALYAAKKEHVPSAPTKKPKLTQWIEE